MEMLALLLILTSLEKNSDLPQKLRSALAFYRENKELITMFANAANGAPSAGGAPNPAPPQSGEKKESRPSGERVDSLKILEDYLSRAAV